MSRTKHHSIPIFVLTVLAIGVFLILPAWAEWSIGGWVLCGFIARGILLGNLRSEPVQRDMSVPRERDEDIFMYWKSRAWGRSLFRRGPIGLIEVLWRISRPRAPMRLRFRFTPR
jgi:hypothetical protein